MKPVPVLHHVRQLLPKAMTLLKLVWYSHWAYLLIPL